MSRSHHLFSSINTATPYKTACGRTFDPVTYTELLQAAMDQQWAQAIQKQLREDKEYLEMLRVEGGGAQTIDALGQSAQFSNDEEFMAVLKPVLLSDKKTALSICAIQDAYVAIRKKRDEHQTNVAADGSDPYGDIKKRGNPFGSTNVQP